MELQQLLNDGSKLNGQELVCLVHDEHGTLAQIGDGLASEIENTARGSDNDMDGVLQTHNVVAKASATSGDHDVDAEVLAESLANLRCLHGELACGDEDEALDFGDFGVDLFEGGDNEGGGLAGAVLGAGQDIATGQGDRDGFFLDGRGLLKTGLEDSHQQIPLQLEVLEFQTFRVCDILKV
ncbi:hypothetical protein VDGD_21002 [Verticillium dahliae]|nr:hypothetical protein VDGD_21002 [Verticillium dahliae]